MATNVKSNLVVLLLSLYVLFVTAISPSGGDSTVYEILKQFGLPIGLLPDSVESYSLSSDGSFVVELAKPCYVQFDYLVYYEKHITGKLKYGSITKLEGIQVQRFLFWFDVNEIRVDLPPSDSIYFQVGFINKKLSVDQFNTIHSCRDNGLILCGQSLKRALELPSAVNDIPMLITE